jgi:hypothetical protein
MTTKTADIIASRARTARLYYAREDGGAEVSILASTLQQALRSAVEWTRGGDYDREYVGETVTQHVRVWRARKDGQPVTSQEYLQLLSAGQAASETVVITLE